MAVWWGPAGWQQAGEAPEPAEAGHRQEYFPWDWESLAGTEEFGLLVPGRGLWLVSQVEEDQSAGQCPLVDLVAA